MSIVTLGLQLSFFTATSILRLLNSCTGTELAVTLQLVTKIQISGKKNSCGQENQKKNEFPIIPLHFKDKHPTEKRKLFSSMNYSNGSSCTQTFRNTGFPLFRTDKIP